jgi:hypothetical protein
MIHRVHHLDEHSAGRPEIDFAAAVGWLEVVQIRITMAEVVFDSLRTHFHSADTAGIQAELRRI